MRPESCIGANGLLYARTQRYTKLIAMYPPVKQEQVVKPYLYRFVEDRLTELEMTHEELAKSMSRMLGFEYKIHRLTRRINNPESFPAAELHAFYKSLKIEDFYKELVVNFGAGIDGCSPREFDQLLRPLGYQLGRVHCVAA